MTTDRVTGNLSVNGCDSSAPRKRGRKPKAPAPLADNLEPITAQLPNNAADLVGQKIWPEMELDGVNMNELTLITPRRRGKRPQNVLTESVSNSISKADDVTEQGLDICVRLTYF